MSHIVGVEYFDLFVNRSKPLPSMINDGNYDSVHANLYGNYYPFERGTSFRKRLGLVTIEGHIRTRDVKAALRGEGLVPEEFPELCAVGFWCPELQVQSEIVALGVKIQPDPIYHSYPLLKSYYGKRRLTLRFANGEDDWRGDISRFLVSPR